MRKLLVILNTMLRDQTPWTAETLSAASGGGAVILHDSLGSA
jgi:hypothetical protein